METILFINAELDVKLFNAAVGEPPLPSDIKLKTTFKVSAEGFGNKLLTSSKPAWKYVPDHTAVIPPVVNVAKLVLLY